jgi:sulfatase maturation enzyme AslB (radical SAM superfamily)
MTKSIHCPMIHGGLQINLKNSEDAVRINHCCLRSDLKTVPMSSDIWASPTLLPLRELNKQNTWHSGCWTCQGNELAGQTSFRTGTLEMFGNATDLSGPQRLDLMFDIGCNLACRSCGPNSSTYWQKHLLENGLSSSGPSRQSRVDDMIGILKTLDLSNLRLVVFCGGETLLGSGYWQVAEVLADLVPNAQNQLILSFQTNGTQTIDQKYYSLIEKFHLVKLNISLDGVGEQFEYLRWPASWQQVVDNIMDMRENLPVNVMFLIEETMSIFNLYYQGVLDTWAKNNFATNRLGDVVNHTRHVATGIFSLNNLSQEYVDSLKGTPLAHLINPSWKEQSNQIQQMIKEIERFDAIRNQNWANTFPEVFEFYKRFTRSGI